MYYYIDKATKIFAFPSKTQLNDPAYEEVPTAPESGLSRWSGNQWVLLTATEIENNFPSDDEGTKSEIIATPDLTTENALVLWSDKQGSALQNSPLVYQNASLKIPGNIDITGDYLINGVPIHQTLDQQKVLKTNEKNYSNTSWQLIPDLLLTTKNTVTAKYYIQIELLVKTNRSNRDFDFALFINNQQNLANTLSIDFNRGQDDKTINWSDDDIQLDPGSVISVYWRRSGYSGTCYVGRRKLRISEQPSYF